MPSTPTQPSDRFLRTPEVFRLTGYARTTIDRMIRAGQFPAPTRIGRALHFSEQEVQAWIEARKAEREVSK